MITKTRDFAFEIKAIRDNGTFEGYGSVFGVKDGHGEIVAPGAFTESLQKHKAQGTIPALLWQHRQDEPCGAFTSMAEDSRGLKVSGQLALKTVRGAEAYEFLRMGAVSGLSIGFRTQQDGWDKSGIRTLKKVDLLEVSIVTFPSNDAARVEAVKSIQSIRQAEQALRDAGFSRNEAAIFLSRVKSLTPRDAGQDNSLKAIFAALRKRSFA